MMHMDAVIVAFLAAIGLAFGSFVGALVWRLHEHKDFVRGRSECEYCHHRLAAVDLVPVLSWLMLKGKCRYCHKPIGWNAPLLELSVGALFVLSYIYWPLPFTSWQSDVSFVLWLVYLVGLAALFVYDVRYMLLPNVILFPLIVLSVVESAVRYTALSGVNLPGYLGDASMGVMTLAGLYWVLYTFSRGKWVGYGDVKLGIFMGIALGFRRSLLALFLANILGFIVVLPGLLAGKLTRRSRVPFGPFLIAAFVIAFLFGDTLIEWYVKFILLQM